MKRKIFFILSIIFVLATGFIFTKPMLAENISDRLRGRILLQVEQNGEAWYVNPDNGMRYYMGRPDDAFRLMRELGIGITNSDLEKIQIADANLSGDDNDNDGLSNMIEDSFGSDINNSDSDGDGYNDKLEVLSGYDPLGIGRFNLNNAFAVAQSGRILLQVEQNGEAWYVNPVDKKRYFLGRPIDAFNVMRNTGLGITDSDLETISDNPEGVFEPNVPYSFFLIHEESWYNQDYSNAVQEIIDLANQYNVPVTIAFWPGVVDIILSDPEKIAKVKEWQSQGHEIGIHTQGAYEIECDYGVNCWEEEYFEKYEQLLDKRYQTNIKSGTIGGGLGSIGGLDPYLDKVGESYIYQANGRYDGRTSKVLMQTMGERQIYTLGINAGYCYNPSNSETGSQEKIDKYNTLNSNEIFGFGMHTADALGGYRWDNSGLSSKFVGGCGLEELEKWFKFLYDEDPEGIKRKTISGIMDDYVLPNNLIVSDSHIPCSDFSSGSQNYSYDAPNFDGNGCIGTETLRFELGRIAPSCGDGYCYGETINTCPKDCEAVWESQISLGDGEPKEKCGDGECDDHEIKQGNCPEDCPK